MRIMRIMQPADLGDWLQGRSKIEYQIFDQVWNRVGIGNHRVVTFDMIVFGKKENAIILLQISFTVSFGSLNAPCI